VKYYYNLKFKKPFIPVMAKPQHHYSVFSVTWFKNHSNMVIQLLHKKHWFLFSMVKTI